MLERDAAVTSPSLPRAYADGAPAGDRGADRGRRRQPVPRLQRRHRRLLDRPRPPPGGRGGRPPGRRPAPLLGQRLLPARLLRVRRGPGRDRAHGRAGAGLPDQLGDRGRRGGAEAGPGGHRPPVRDQLLRRLPRPQLRLGQPDRLQGQVPRRVRAAAPGGAARPLRLLPPLPAQPDLPRVRPRHRRLAHRHPVPLRGRPGRGRGRVRRADPGRGRLHHPAARAGWRSSRPSASATASCSWPTRSSRAWAGPGGCGRSSTPGSSRTC